MTKVITYGTFDLFHEGHYRLLERAKALGDYLIVGVTSEGYDVQRGKLNVIDPLMKRIENVQKSGFADEIIVEESFGQKVGDIKKYDVDIFTVGSDWIGVFDYLNDYCKVVYLERTKDISSTMLRQTNYKIQRAGIIGTGRIAGRFVAEAKRVSGINTQAVYNPHVESASRFADKYELNYYTSLEELMDAVDMVYIASPHETHYKYAKTALQRGKNVLCEKPMVLRRAEAEELYTLAKENGCILFEAIKTAYAPGFIKLIDVACSGVIGSIKYVDACFTKLEDKESRELTDVTYGGSFTELASYCLLPIIKLFGTDYNNISFNSVNDARGIDIFTQATIEYKHGFATATCGLGVKADGRLLISGTQGYIVVEAPWWKTSYFEVHFEEPGMVEKYTDRFEGDGLRYEISDFIGSINANRRVEFKFSREESITMAAMIETFLKQRLK